MKKEIEEYVKNKKFIIYKKDECDNKLENLYNKIKDELNVHLILLKDKREKIIQKTIEDGIYNIIPKKYENKAIEVNGGSLENMANFQISEYNNSISQKFMIKYNSINQFYIIKCLCSNKVLTVDFTNNDNIYQFKEHHGNAQQWHIVSVGENYEIVSELNGKLLGVNDNSLDSSLSCKQRTGEINQQFEFKNTSQLQTSSQSNPQPQNNIYFPRTPYKGVSIADGLQAIGYDNSYRYRSRIAEVNEIQNYRGTPEQNIEMLRLLKLGLLKKP